ncbi:DUF262 domain-containing protein [Arthrobacter sp. ISL-5]|uniref:GmrSD restriction endonuclease domain-containing protein n=1 Tax=Arthrobacter sp. ISL-5 TaxID=2819111 RepID=UPI001BE52AC6|nr:DUF262 domain-containing protein [Arthrobacter sp. ISL-5]MBT2555509.1 DUF262 domain-containing protein [Arthrobacter sp. ISL-5]
METFKRTPLQLFNLPQHFVIPLFQRPYVWKEDEQWEPLWKDIRRVAELRISKPHLAPQHFLGAVVLQAHEAESARLTTWNVIDGQQRLTTLQLLADATCAIFAQAGLSKYASQLEGLTHNSESFIEEDESPLKVRHLNNDHDAFLEVMTVEPPVDHSDLKHHESRIVHAHRYFTTAVTQWLGNPGTDDFATRAKELARVLLDDLQLVTIELKASENSQEIFETLNARGTPLTAADLIRNFVFQRLEAEGGDTKKAYREDWPFEARFWTKEVSVGRYFVTRSSLFFNQWLISRTGEEISPQSTFTRFKSYVELTSGHKMVDLLAVIKQQAALYEMWTEASLRPDGNLGAVEMAFHRMNAAGIELLKPLMLWLYEPGRDRPQQVIDAVIGAAESWVIRRQLLRLTGSDLGRIVAELIHANSDVEASELVERVTGYLARLNVSSTYWPGDDEIRVALKDEPAYRRYPRPRLRMFLEAIENHYRAETKQAQVVRAGLPIEHILPQMWQENWPVETPEEQQDRQAHVHRLGNLTLLTGPLNSKVSNGPWSAKRDAMLKHNTISLTGRVVADTEGEAWRESLIDHRTEVLVEALLRVWPVPNGHKGQVVDPQAKAEDWVQLKHLIAAGLLAPGDKLIATHRDFKGVEALVTADGSIELGGKRFTAPSSAGHHLRKKATNGWYFWAVADGRRLRDLRAQLQSTAASIPADAEP